MTVPLDRLPWVRGLALTYSHAYDRLASFYAGNPKSSSAWRESIGRLRERAFDRDALVEVLTRQQERRQAPAAARRNAERLRDGGCVAVVTGQQAGAAGGPLYTLLKALTAIRVAECVERKHGTPAVPVFWIDAEDHDWDEVAGLTLLDAEFHPTTLTVPRPAGANHVPVASVVLDASVESFVADVAATLPPTEFTSDLVRRLAAAYRPGTGMADAFGQWLESVLGPRGLILYDCSDPAAKPLSAGVFVHELSHPGRTAQLAAEAGASLTSEGFHAQVDSRPDGIALFRIGSERHLIVRDGGDLTAGHERVPSHEWVARAEREPQGFSPNVLLRPIVQDTLFPTIAYVAGPSELAYLGQLKGVYEHFGLPMPLIVPRATATITDANATRFLSKTALDFTVLQAQDESELNRFLQSHLPPGVESSMEAAQQATSDSMARVIAALPALDATLEGAARSTLGRMEHELRTLHSKVIHAAKKRDETLRRQFLRTRALVFPQGHLQERTIGFLWFLNRYGPAFVDVLERDLPLDGSVHALLTV
ncbi:MAG: bacillithiol biosynthesis cysteine-adding enzyme BshC [Vicinamibacterales bacterium]